MRQTVRFLTPCAAGAVLLLWGTQPLSGQVIDPEARMSPVAGVWIFSPELSTDMSEVSGRRGGGTGGGGGVGRGGGGTGRGGGSMGRGGGSMGRGGGGVGRGGGGVGRGGGSMGRGGGGTGGRNVSEEDQLKMRVLARETSMPAERLTLAVTEHTFIVTDEFGVVHEYYTDGKEQEIDFVTAQIDTRTKWEGTVLKQEMEAADMKVTRTYQASLEGALLIVTLQTQGGRGGRGGGGEAPVIKWIYEREG